MAQGNAAQYPTTSLDITRTISRTIIRRTAMGAVVVLVGCYYWWAVRAAGGSMEWRSELTGYYNYLGRAFSIGQLHLPIEPAAELLALADPWDPIQQRLPQAIFVLYKGRYYLYHGAGPALLLFVPWRVITGHDLPEAAAVAAFCFGAFLFYAAALLRLLTICACLPNAAMLSMWMLALGVCQSAPYLCNRVNVYEVAIAGGMFCVSAAFFFFIRGLTSGKSNAWLAASGLAFGLAVACRAHLIFAGCIAFMALIVWTRFSLARLVGWKGIAGFLGAFVMCGAAIGLYNYARFEDPFEFGLRYLLAGDKLHQRLLPSVWNLLPGLYYMLVSPPDFSSIFPWVTLVLRLPFGVTHYPFPPGYFLEPIAGVLWVAPLLIVSSLRPARTPRSIRLVFWTALLGAISVLTFIAAIGFATQRYLADFVPLLVFVAVSNLAIRTAQESGWSRFLLVLLSIVFVLYGGVVNLALGIIGPYGDMVSKRPSSYVRIAQWFSPVDEYRPRLNPSVRIVLDATFAPNEPGYVEPLVTFGVQGSRHSVLVEHRSSELRLVCRSDNGIDLEASAAIVNKPSRIEISHDPRSRKLDVAVDGRNVIEQPIATLVTTKAQVMIGANGQEGFGGQRFSGQIHTIEKAVW